MPGSNPTSPSQSILGGEGNGSTPQSTLASPEPQHNGPANKDGEDKRDSKEKCNGTDKRDSTPPKTEEEVEALSDMMCSLVTNNCGETRYIGMVYFVQGVLLMLTRYRIVLWVFHLLAERYPVGQ